MNATDTPPAHRPPGKPWSVPDAAEYLDVSTRHLRRLISAGKVKAVKLGTRTVVPDAEVRRAANEGARP